jgi:hypothetical protein
MLMSDFWISFGAHCQAMSGGVTAIIQKTTCNNSMPKQVFAFESYFHLCTCLLCVCISLESFYEFLYGSY